MDVTSAFQTALHLLYPPRCLLCEADVGSDFGLCASCWADTPFISGLVCDLCGVPLIGEDADEVAYCDDCLHVARPWSRGRAALLYRDNGRKLVLALKHGDRHDVVRPAARWLVQAASPFLSSDVLIAPIPLHWRRMLRRRYNQSALLTRAMADLSGLETCPDLLLRNRRTKSLDGLSAQQRFEMLVGAIGVNPRHQNRIEGRSILLVDDVMTSGATFAAATESLTQAGADQVFVISLARVTKDA